MADRKAEDPKVCAGNEEGSSSLGSGEKPKREGEVVYGAQRQVYRKLAAGTSLAVQWSGLCASTAGDMVRFLVLIGELKSYMPCNTTKNKK